MIATRFILTVLNFSSFIELPTKFQTRALTVNGEEMSFLCIQITEKI